MRNKLLADFYQQLNPDNSMTFNRLLAHSLGAVETIILFTLIGKYYYYADKEMIDENGWFYVTVPDLHESTSFGEKIQRNAIKHLESMGFIQTSVKGIPPKRYFKVNNDMELLEKYLVKGKEISDGIKLKAAEDNAKKVAAANAKRRKKNKTIPADSQFLPNGGINSSNKNEQIIANYKTQNAADLFTKIEKISASATVVSAENRERNATLVSMLKSYYLKCYSENNMLKCECCGEETFITAAGEPYVEFHHLIPFNIAYGPDHYLNLFALCPNCHRKIHFLHIDDKCGPYEDLSNNNYMHLCFTERLKTLRGQNLLKSYHLEFLLADNAITLDEYNDIAA